MPGFTLCLVFQICDSLLKVNSTGIHILDVRDSLTHKILMLVEKLKISGSLSSSLVEFN